MVFLPGFGMFGAQPFQVGSLHLVTRTYGGSTSCGSLARSFYC